MKRRNNGEGSLYFSEKKNLYVGQCIVGIDNNGKNIRKTVYGKTKSECIAKLEDAKFTSAKGIYRDDKGYTLNEWLEKWFVTYKIHDFKETTYEKEYRRANKIRESQLAYMKLEDIRPMHIQNFINTLSKTLSSKTISNISILLNGCLKQAMKENLILNNPCESVTKPKVKRPDTVALGKEELELFNDVAKYNTYYDFMVFALETGMREAEICGLQREDVDLQKGIITVKHQLVRVNGGIRLQEPKTEKSIRIVPIRPKARQILEKYMFGEYSKIDFVFYNPSTKGVLNANVLSINARKIFDKCFELSKNEIFDKATFHSLRHTFATAWVRNGGDYKLLGDIIGHTDISFTMKVYAQPTTQDKIDAMLQMQI